MGATYFNQLKLLCTKNFKVKVYRNPINFLCEILLPCCVGFLLVWARGYVIPQDMDSMKYFEYEFNRWPAGLDVPALNANNESEFLLFYAPSGGDNDGIVQGAVDIMNEDYAKWYLGLGGFRFFLEFFFANFFFRNFPLI